MATYKLEIQLTTVETYDPRLIEACVLRGLATKEFGIAGHARVVAKLESESASGPVGPTGQSAAMVRP